MSWVAPGYSSGGTDVVVADGGTGRSVTVAYAPIVGGTTTTAAMQSVLVGSAGQVLQSGGASAIPVYSTATYPSAASTAGKILHSDGTNFLSTTPTGTGTPVLATSPTLVTPLLGTPTSGDLTNCTLPAKFRVECNSRPSITDSVITKVILDTESFDTSGYFDSTTNYRFTPLIAGYYLITAQVAWDVTAVSGVFYTLIRLNGATVASNVVSNSSGSGFVLPAVTILNLNGSTDYVELYTLQVTGSSETIYDGSRTFLSGVRLL